jgi:dCMP deaminase
MIIVMLDRQGAGPAQEVEWLAEAGFTHVGLDSVVRPDDALARQAFAAFGDDFRIRLARARFDPLRNELVTGVANLEEILALSRMAPTGVLDPGFQLGATDVRMLEAARVPVRQGREGSAGKDGLLKLLLDVATRLPRLGWDDYFMRIASTVAGRGDCLKRRVAAIIVRDRRIIATGYNGTPRGTTNCAQGGCPRCASFGKSGTALEDCLCSHGEENAITQAAYHGISVHGATLYSTCSPCLLCTKMIINSGLAEVVFNAGYPLGERSLELLRESQVKVRQLILD